MQRQGTELGICAELRFEFLLNDVEVNFALTADQCFARIGIFADREALVLFGETVETAKNLVFRTAYRGIHRHIQNGLVEGNRVKFDRSIFVAERVACSGIDELADGSDVARTEFRNGFKLLAADKVDRTDAFCDARVGVEDAHARLENTARNHAGSSFFQQTGQQRS